MMKNKYKVLIISCWVLLLLCFIAKLFGADIFNIAVKNETFIQICDWLDQHELFKYIITTIFYIPTTYLAYLTMVNKKIGQDWWIIILCLPCSYLKGLNSYVGFALDMIILIVIPLIVGKLKNWLYVLIGVGAIILFQQISLFIRNQNFYLVKDSLLINIIMSIDYYIMVILYYLHIRYYKTKKNKKEDY